MTGVSSIDRRVAERAAQLGPGRRLVMLSGGNDVETIVSYLGALRGGHVPWLVPKGPSEELVERFDPDVVVSRCAGFPVIRHRRAGSVHRLHPELALLLGTSGSTGAPRLVRLSHENLMSNAEAIADYLGITRADRAITTLPLHYCYGLSVLHSHLVRGASLTLTDASVNWLYETEPEEGTNNRNIPIPRGKVLGGYRRTVELDPEHIEARQALVMLNTFIPGFMGGNITITLRVMSGLPGRISPITSKTFSTACDSAGCRWIHRSSS